MSDAEHDHDRPSDLPVKFENPFAVTVDAIVFAKEPKIGSGYSVLLVRRLNDPFKNLLAFPGGFLEATEAPWDGALRELHEETGLYLSGMRQYGAVGAPGRDPRGPTISIVFTAQLPEPVPVVGKDDAKEALWVPISDLAFPFTERLAFDHQQILTSAYQDSRTWEGPFARQVPPTEEKHG